MDDMLMCNSRRIMQNSDSASAEKTCCSFISIINHMLPYGKGVEVKREIYDAGPRIFAVRKASVKRPVSYDTGCCRGTKSYRSRLKRASVFLIVAALSLLSAIGCSHIRPYYSDDVVQPDAAAVGLGPGELSRRFLLIGDTGAPGEYEPVLQLLTEWASEIPEKTVVAFLGDNIYPSGMPAVSGPDRPEAERRLNEQLEVLRESDAEGWFIPGNHDWAGGGSENKLTSVGHGKETLFAHLHTGFMALDFLLDGRVLLRVLEPAEQEVVFRMWLEASER